MNNDNTMVRVANSECLERIEEIVLSEETNKKSKEALIKGLLESIRNELTILEKICVK